MKGIINSFQSLGTLDGPGLRTVIFMQGCPLRCINCHNPETWSLDGDTYCLNDIYLKILRYENYINPNGGVTISGGEPLLQWEFVAGLFSKLQKAGIHTALDTSGIGDFNGAREVLKHTNLVICDLKFSSQEEYLKNCKADMQRVLNFIELTQEEKIPLWIRHLIIPGITDNLFSIKKIISISKEYNNLEKLEFLPFKKVCIHKYEALGLTFPLAEADDCSDELLSEIQAKARFL
jgi:pyruvate formate lyase activating enzyme